MSAGFAALYTVYALRLHRLVRTAGYDLGIFDQAIRGYAHFNAPVVPLKAPGFHLLGDHFHPVLVALTPLYWIWDDPRMLLAAQAVLLASSVPAVWLFARRALGERAATWVAAAYGLSWGIQSMVGFDFHELAFAVPLTAWALERMQAGRWRTGVCCVLALLLVKEDLSLLVVAFGIYAALVGRRKLGAALAVIGLVGYEVITTLLIPHFSGGTAFAYWNYTALGADLPSSLWFLVRHPFRAVEIALTPPVKRSLVLWLFLPTTLLALLSPIVVLAVPLLAERLFSSNEHHWVTGFHYNAVLMPIVFLAGVDGLHRLGAPPRRVAMAWMAIAVALCARFAFHELATPGFWQDGPRSRAAYGALRHIPDGAFVASTNRLAPQLTPRAEVVLFNGTDYGQEWVIADFARPEYPFKTLDQAREVVHRLLDEGWQVVFKENGYLVLHRP